MTNISQKIAKLTAIATIVATVAMPFTAKAAELQNDAAMPTSVAPWSVAILARDAGTSRIEAFKVDKNLVAWSEVTGSVRNLYAYNGAEMRLLASFSKDDWKDDGGGFYDAVKGNFDVADGKVVWTMSDGSDREIFAYDGDAVTRVSDNAYDDRHPITSAGRVAWTSQPSATAYNLMVKDVFGIRRVDAWPVTNYAFSGSNLFWLNTRPNEPWMHVFVNTGLVNSTIGQGDDRSWMSNYFITDGKGNAAWEYSTKNWAYDKRITYVSVGGAKAIQVVQRDVPPTVTRIEDMDNGKVMMNIDDLLLTDLQHRTTLIEFAGYLQNAISRKETFSKVRYIDGGYVRHREPGANNALVAVNTETGAQDIISYDAVILDRFEADGNAAAGARVGGGLVTYVDGKGVIIPSTVETTQVAVKNGNIAWIEGAPGNQTLKFATTGVVVKNGASASTLTGHLVKASNSPAVYFAARDGQRYVFNSEALFHSWFKDFSTVSVVSPAKLASMPLAGHVLYKPGTKLLKTANSPKIYSIDSNGTIHWVQNEETMIAMYGLHWKNLVTVVDETELAIYPMGGNLNTYYAYGPVAGR